MDDRDERPETLERYEDPKLEALGELLDQLEADGAMDLEELDGFFTALHCAPQMVPREEYLPEIFGTGESLDNQEIFSGPDSAKLMWNLIFHHWNSVKEVLSSAEAFVPLLLEDDEGRVHGNNWARGFMRGVGLREDLWEELFDDEHKYEWIAPIITLNYEHHPDPALRPWQTPWTEEEREVLLKDVSKGVSELYRHFAKHRAAHTAMQTLKRSALSPEQPIQKIGRNDPCYCGSGVKYKKCCGGSKVN